MTDREKLAALLEAAEDAYLDKLCEIPLSPERVNLVRDAYGFYADYLIAKDVTVQKHGRWYQAGFTSRLVECSVCEDWFFRVADAKYCPNCGAKMDLKGENDE